MRCGGVAQGSSKEKAMMSTRATPENEGSVTGPVFVYLVAFLILLFLFVSAQPVYSRGLGKLLSWALVFSFLACLAAPVVAITAIAIGVLWSRDQRPSKVWLVAGVAAVGAAALPLIAGVHIKRACDLKPMDWNGCIDSAYATRDGLSEGYRMAGAQIFAVIVVYAWLRRSAAPRDSVSSKTEDRV